MTKDRDWRAAGEDAAKSREGAWYQVITSRLRDARRALIGKYDDFFQRVDEWSGGRLGIVRAAFSTVREERGPEAAASMAYYALFSLFPLALFTIGLGSLLLDREAAFRQTVQLLNEAIPVPTNLVIENVRQVLELRGPVTVVSLGALLWSATRFFYALTRNIDRAWPESQKRPFVKTRLIGMSMVVSLAVLMFLSFLLTAAARYLSRVELPLGGELGLYDSPAWQIAASFFPWFVTLVLFLLLYRWVPNARVSWRAAFWGAIITATVWQLAASAFAWYVSNVGHYRLIYGSLGAMIILTVWVYLAAWITLFGAHLTAALARSYGETEGLDAQ